jgi:hypothetical protein
MKADELNIIHEKAKTKNTGVYSFRGNLYAVKDGHFLAFVNLKGEVLRRAGSFNLLIGNLSSIERYHWKKKLVEWLQTQ